MRVQRCIPLLLLAACGSLEVQVDVLDPRVIEREVDRIQFRQSTLGTALGQSRAELEREFSELRAAHRQFYVDLATQFVEAKKLEMAGLSDTGEDEGTDLLLQGMLEGIAQGIPALFDDGPGKRYEEVQEAIWRLFLEARELARQQDGAPAVEAARLGQRIQALARDAGESKADFVAWIEEDIVQAVRGAREGLDIESVRDGLTPQQFDAFSRKVSRSAERAQQAVDVAATSLVGQGSLFQDSYAFAVANASEEDWALHYNRVFGRGRFGDLNVAIKMNSPADFTLKGLTFDPSAVASIAAKVSTQALLVATQISGVPVDVGSDGTSPGGALAGSSAELASMQARIARGEALRADYQDALITIGLAITREADARAGFRSRNPAVRAKSAAAIQATFDAHKPRLQLKEASAGAGQPGGPSPARPAPGPGSGQDSQDEAASKGADEPEPALSEPRFVEVLSTHRKPQSP